MGKTWGLEEFTAVDVVSFIVGLLCTAPAGNCFENRTKAHSREKIIVIAITFNSKGRCELEGSVAHAQVSHCPAIYIRRSENL